MKTVQVFMIVFIVLSAQPVLGQTQSDNEPKRIDSFAQLRIASQKRDLDELLASISTRDRGAFDLVQVRGSLPSDVFESHSILKQIVQDDRVTRVFQLLRQLPKKQAAQKVSNSFNRNFGKLKSLRADGKKFDSPLTYAIHVDLFLSFKFEENAKYIKRFEAWNAWFSNELTALEWSQLAAKSPNRAKRIGFIRSARPELLMYLNLLLAEQLKQSDFADLGSTEFAEMLTSSGWNSELGTSFQIASILPVNHSVNGTDDIDPVYEIPLFDGWHGLDGLNNEKRLRLFADAREIVSPSNTVQSTLNTFQSLIRSRERDLRNLARKYLEPTSTGTLIVFEKHRTKKLKGWSSNYHPTKSTILAQIDEIRTEWPDDDGTDWDGAIKELKEWINEIPEKGISVQKRKKVWEWPVKFEANGSKDGKRKPIARIKIVLRNTTAFVGTAKKAQSKSNERK